MSNGQFYKAYREPAVGGAILTAQGRKRQDRGCRKCGQANLSPKFRSPATGGLRAFIEARGVASGNPFQFFLLSVCLSLLSVCICVNVCVLVG